MTLVKICVGPVLLWSCTLTPTVFPSMMVAPELLCTWMLPLTLFPSMVTAAELLATCRLPLMVLPAQDGVPEPMRTGAPLLWTTRLLVIVLPQTWFAVVLLGRLVMVRLPLMVVDGPMVKLPPLVIVTLPPMVAPWRMRLPPLSVTVPVVPPADEDAGLPLADDQASFEGTAVRSIASGAGGRNRSCGCTVKVPFTNLKV